jgi:hypothetical protein
LNLIESTKKSNFVHYGKLHRKWILSKVKKWILEYGFEISY